MGRHARPGVRCRRIRQPRRDDAGGTEHEENDEEEGPREDTKPRRGQSARQRLISDPIQHLAEIATVRPSASVIE